MDTDPLSPASHSCQRPVPRGPVPAAFLPMKAVHPWLVPTSDRPPLPYHQIKGCKMEKSS